MTACESHARFPSARGCHRTKLSSQYQAMCSIGIGETLYALAIRTASNFEEEEIHSNADLLCLAIVVNHEKTAIVYRVSHPDVWIIWSHCLPFHLALIMTSDALNGKVSVAPSCCVWQHWLYIPPCPLDCIQWTLIESEHISPSVQLASISSCTCIEACRSGRFATT